MKILKFNEGFFRKYDVDITNETDKNVFNRYSDEDQFELGDIIRIKNGFRIINVMITDIEESESIFRNQYNQYQIFFIYKFSKDFTDDDKLELDKKKKLYDIEQKELSKKKEKSDKRYEDMLKKYELNRVEFKKELDLIFIEFLDRGINTKCVITDRNESSVYYEYGFEVEYRKNSIISKTFEKITEDMKNIESYVEYIETKYTDIKSYIDYYEEKLLVSIRATM
jgi:ribosomal 50S subunit-recycling heat shock protein